MILQKIFKNFFKNIKLHFMDKMQSTKSPTTLISNELKKVEIPVFNSIVYFYRGNYDDFIKVTKDNNFNIDFENTSSAADGLSFDFEGVQLIWVDTNASNAVKIHELLHAVLNICDSRGINRKDDEVLCYMLEYLVKSL